METIDLDVLPDVTGGLRAKAARTPPSVFDCKGTCVVNGPVILDNRFEMLMKKQGFNPVQELRIPRASSGGLG